MRVLIDSDVLLDVALDRAPFVEASSSALDLGQAGALSCFVAWHSIANYHYFVRKLTPASAKDFVRDLLSFAEVVTVGHADMEYALELDMPDLEDAMQAAAAVACRAARIITRNTRHYKHSPIPAVTPTSFLRTLRRT